jgi:hypothetical protein
MQNESIDDLEFVFENCNFHELAETNLYYLEDFGKTLDHDFTDISLVASGSIGQVYKAFSREHNCFVAIKSKQTGYNNMIDNNKYIVICKQEISLFTLSDAACLVVSIPSQLTKNNIKNN